MALSFRTRSRPIDWGQVNRGLPVDAVLKDAIHVGPEEIQSQLDNLCFGKCVAAGVEQATMVKGFELCQLTIEYLLNIQESLAANLERSREELEQQRKKERKARAANKLLQTNLTDLQTTLSAASHMLTTFGVNTEPLRRMCEGDFGEGGGAKAPVYVWVPAFMDPFDGKSFQSAEHLKRHMFGHHGAEIRACLASGRGGGASDVGPQPPPPPPAPLERSRAESAPLDACEAAAREVVGLLSVAGRKTVTRRALLDALARLREAPRDCGLYHLAEPPLSSAGAGFTVHDFLTFASSSSAMSSAMDEAVELDWKAVDAHLRTLRQVLASKTTLVHHPI
jgi:hypothetical protein